jgi:hypothetical protein
VLSLSLLLLQVCIVTQTPQGRATSIVLADVGHTTSTATHTVLDREAAGYSQLWSAFSKRSCILRINREPFSAAMLTGISVLVATAIAADKPLAAGEVQTLRRFVESGGTLLLVNGDLEPSAVGMWKKLAGEFAVQSHGEVLRWITPQGPSTHISRYSGAGLARWLRGLEDAQLYCQGSTAGPTGGEVLISYDGSALAAMQPVGKGKVYVFGGDLLSNAYTAGKPQTAEHGELPAANARLLDGLIDELLESAREPQRAKP